MRWNKKLKKLGQAFVNGVKAALNIHSPAETAGTLPAWALDASRMAITKYDPQKDAAIQPPLGNEHNAESERCAEKHLSTINFESEDVRKLTEEMINNEICKFLRLMIKANTNNWKKMHHYPMIRKIRRPKHVRKKMDGRGNKEA